MITITAVGGYNDIGRNCTAITVDDETAIVDLGLHLENYIHLTDNGNAVIDGDKLISVGAAPDISIVDKEKVKGIVISHAHLDHVGAAPFLAGKLKAPVYGTPFTMEVLQSVLKEEKISLPNEMIVLESNAKQTISDKISVEFIHITHSTPDTALVVIHTPYGAVVYANDFKLDRTPTLGDEPNFKRIKELSGENVLALICESTYAPLAGKTPSEAVAQEHLKNVMLDEKQKGHLMIVTTFSSHIARLQSIVTFGKKIERKILFLGRSLAKYVYAAQNIGLIDFEDDIEIVKYSKQIERRLKKITDREKYLLVVTGHQGEPTSVLSKIAKKEIAFSLLPKDAVIFSCRTIPTEENIQNREALEAELKQDGVSLYTDVHESGHAANEDLKEMIAMIQPKCIIPSHGNEEMKKALAQIALNMGFSEENVYLLHDKNSIKIQT